MGGRRAISGAALLRCWSATFSSSSKHWRSRKSNTRGQHREMVLGLCKFALSERTCISMCVRAPARSRVDACVTKARLHVCVRARVGGREGGRESFQVACGVMCWHLPLSLRHCADACVDIPPRSIASVGNARASARASSHCGAGVLVPLPL